MRKKGWSMGYRAVIFDMDGVLIDSEFFYLQRFHREIVKKYPWVAIEDLYPTVGMDEGRTRLLISRLARRDPADPAFDAELQEIFASGEELYYPDFLYPEVPEVLRELKERGLRIGLASSSPMKAIRNMLKECALADCFSCVVSGYELPESKPNPEVYYKAMQAIGCGPGECLVVEDSTHGVKAGAAAGAKVAARMDERFPFDQSKASYFIRTLRDLREILF